MSITLVNYRRLEELRPILKNNLKDRSKKAPNSPERIFLVPEANDRSILKELLDDLLKDCMRELYQFNQDDAQKFHAADKIFRWNELYRYFVENLNKIEKSQTDPKDQIDPPDHWLLTHSIVKSYGGELPPGARQNGFLHLLGAQIRELIREEVSPEALDELGADPVLGSAFADLYRAYIAALNEQNLSDSAGLSTTTRQLIEDHIATAKSICARLEIVLLGFSSLTHSQLELIRCLSQNGARVQIFAPIAGFEHDYGMAEQFSLAPNDPGNLAERFDPPADSDPFRFAKIQAGDPRHEFETVARLLTLWEQNAGELSDLGSFPGWEKISIVVPASSMAKAREAFSRYKLPCCWNFNTTVSDAPLWRIASACLSAAEGDWQTEPVLQLLSQPWLCGQNLPVEEFRKEHPRGLNKWKEVLAQVPIACDELDRCEKFASAVRRGGKAIDLLRALNDFAQGRALRVASLIKPSPELDSQLAAYNAALNELNHKILFLQEVVYDLGKYGSEDLDASASRAWLKAWADGAAITLRDNETNQLTVFANQPPTLFRSDYCFLMDSDAKTWPGSLKESPLLSEERKEKLHQNMGADFGANYLPLLPQKRQQREHLFRRLLACGEKMTFLCYAKNDEGDHPQDITGLLKDAQNDKWVEDKPFMEIKRELSQLLPKFGEDVIKPVEIYASGPVSAPRSPTPISLPQGAQNHVTLSSVDDFNDCPYLFAVKNKLKLPSTFYDRELDAAARGNVVHRVFELAWHDYAAQDENKIKIWSLLAAVKSNLDRAIDEEYPKLREHSLRREKENLYNSLLASAATQEEIFNAFAAEQCGRIQVICEEKLDYVLDYVLDYPLEAQSLESQSLESPDGSREELQSAQQNIKFVGRCDRIDKLPNGKFLLWDYKSGQSRNYKDKLQLACYALALEKTQRYGTWGGWGYICLRDNAIAGKYFDEDENVLAEALQEEREKATDLLQRIAESFRQNSFPALYTYSAKTDKCQNCQYSELCRKGEFRGFESEDSETSNDGE